MARTRDLTQGTPFKLILLFALPILAENALQQLYNLVDSLVMGRVEGVAALAAVSAAGWLDWGVLGIAMGLTQGISIQIAQCFGAGDWQGVRRNAGQGILLAGGVVAVLELTAQPLLLPLLRLINTPADTFPMTALYLRIIYGGMAVIMGVNLLSGFLRAVGDSATPLRAMIAATMANIALDILFVGVCRWGVAGAAAATVTAQLLAFMVDFRAVLQIPELHVARADLRPHGRTLRQLTRLGAPIAFQNTVIAVGGVVLSGVVNSFGFIFMAGYNAAGRLQGVVELAGTALSSAVGTFTGQNCGAGRLDRVRQGLRHSALLAFLLALLISGVMLLWGRQLVALFVQDDAGIVDQVLGYAEHFLWFMSGGLPLLYLLFVYRTALQGSGDTVVPMLSGFVELGMRIGAALILPRIFGEWGIYSAEVLAWGGAAVLLIIGWYRRIRLLELRAAQRA